MVHFWPVVGIYQYIIVIGIFAANQKNIQKNTSVTLGEHFERFISRLTEKGRYSSASEPIRAGLHLLEKEEAKWEALQNALIEGEKSGRANYSLNDFIDELNTE